MFGKKRKLIVEEKNVGARGGLLPKLGDTTRSSFLCAVIAPPPTRFVLIRFHMGSDVWVDWPHCAQRCSLNTFRQHCCGPLLSTLGGRRASAHLAHPIRVGHQSQRHMGQLHIHAR